MTGDMTLPSIREPDCVFWLLQKLWLTGTHTTNTDFLMMAILDEVSALTSVVITAKNVVIFAQIIFVFYFVDRRSCLCRIDLVLVVVGIDRKVSRFIVGVLLKANL